MVKNYQKYFIIIGIILAVIFLSFVYAQNGSIKQEKSQSLRIMKIYVPNMACPGCGWSIEGHLQTIAGVIQSEMIFWEDVEGEILKKGTIVYDSSVINKEQIISEIQKLGYGGEIQSDDKYVGE